jgi:AcrR family transcriptional regulator
MATDGKPTQSDLQTEETDKHPVSSRGYHHGNLRQALLDAAVAIIGEEGAGGFHLRAVARRAGVSPAAPYRHFRDKADLLAEVGSEVAHRLAESMKRELDKAPNNPLEQFRAQGIAFVKFAVQHPDHFRVLNLPEVAARFDDDLHALMGDRNLLEEAIHESERAGQLTAENKATVALAARSITYGLARLMVDGHLGRELPTVEEAEQAAYAVTHLLGVGLLPRK